MSRAFIDTSCVIKLYRPEPDSSAIMVLLATYDDWLLSELTALEVRSAFCGHIRQQSMSVIDAETYISVFDGDAQKYAIVNVDSDVIRSSQDLLSKYAVSSNLRSMDALQLASCLAANQSDVIDSFITTDVALASVALAEGLTVEP